MVYDTKTVDTLPTTPNDAWETYVGGQSTREFMRDETDAEEAVGEYAKDHEFFEDLNTGDKEKVVDLLVQHIISA